MKIIPIILLALWANDDYSLEVCQDVVRRVTAVYPNAPIFAGINQGGYLQKLIDFLKKIKLQKIKLLWEVTPPKLTLPGDASAYQTALREYRKVANCGGDFMIFAHSKGASYPENSRGMAQWRQNYLKAVLSDECSARLGIPTKWGAYGYDIHNIGELDPINSLPSYNPPAEHIPQSCFYPGTIYALRRPLVDDFLDRSPEFLTERIPFRGFFELDFLQIVPKNGYYFGTATDVVNC